MDSEKKIKIKQIVALHNLLRVKMTKTKWSLPLTGDCLRYMAMEASEVIDAELRQNRDHARNNVRMQAETAVGVELADVIIMGLSALKAIEGEYGYLGATAEAIDKAAGTTLEEGIDGVIGDIIVVDAGICLEDYMMIVSNDETAIELAFLSRSIGKTIGHAYGMMIKLGFDPLVFVKNKCQGFAVKHGENYKENYGIEVSDSLEELYSGFTFSG